MLCRPRRPRCGECPLRSGCRAAAGGEPERYPVRVPAPATRRERRVVARVRRADGRVLLFRRPPDRRRLAGLWELPWTTAPAGPEAERELGRRYGGRWRLDEPLARARHAITTRRIQAELWRARRRHSGGALAEGPEAGWYEPGRIAELATSSLDKKLLRAAGPEPARNAPG